MTKKPFDQFAKQFFNTFLSPYSRVDLNFEVPGEYQFIDILFAPSTQPNDTPESLRLLHRIAGVPCLIEPYRKPPDKSDIRSCVQKMFFVQADYERKANRTVNEEELPQLWVITPTASDQIREYSISSPSTNWGRGIYTSPGVLEEVYQEWEEKTRRQGLEQGLERGQSLLIQNMLKARFGELDPELASIIPLLLALPTEEYTNLLLSLSNISREDLIARFK